MMTKTQYAKSIVEEFYIKNCHRPEFSNYTYYTEVKDWGKFINESSKLAVALEFLDLLTDEEKKYTETRGGLERMFTEVNSNGVECAILSTRELLSLLPD